jgi:C4-dicarboxylate transporter DctM subunit
MAVMLMLSFVVFLFLGVPVAIGMGVSGLLSFIFFKSSIPLVVIVQKIYNQLDLFSLMAVPLFILTGQLMNTGGITRKIINFSKIFVGRIPGGLSHVNVIASMLFAGVSGSSTADAAGIGAILIPAMIEDGYEEDWAVCVTAASSTIGPIIPPSILMIVYGSMTHLSIGRLFLCGLIPGILIGVGQLIIGYVLALKRKREKVDFQMSVSEILRSIKECWPTLLAPLIIIVGITGGVFTPTEAGVVAVIYMLIVGLVSKELNYRKLVTVLWETAKSTGVILFIIGCASIFGWVLAYEKVPDDILKVMMSISVKPGMIIFQTIIIMLIAGLFIDGLAAMLIFVPVMFPLTQIIGIDPYHFAMIVILAIVIGGITPPMGVLLYITCAAGNVSIKKVTPLIWVFVIAMMAVLFIVAYIPELVLFIPKLLMGGS